jgi:hypothetical protein
MVGCFCRVERFTTGWHTFRWWRRGWNGGAEVAETTVKRLQWCWFRRTGKAMGQVYKCWWRICREMNVFSRFEYHMFYVLYPFVTYLLTLPRTWSLRPMGEGPGEWGRWVHEKAAVSLVPTTAPTPYRESGWPSSLSATCIKGWCPILHTSTVSVDAACSTETSVSASDNTQGHSSEDSNLTLTSVKTSRRTSVFRIWFLEHNSQPSHDVSGVLYTYIIRTRKGTIRLYPYIHGGGGGGTWSWPLTSNYCRGQE